MPDHPATSPFDFAKTAKRETMTALVAPLFAFLQAELAEEDAASQEARVNLLFASRYLAVFPRDMLMRLGAAPPAEEEPLNDQCILSPLLPWLTMEAVVLDDLPLLFLLLTRGAITVDLRLAAPHDAFPYMLAGDSLYKYVERFPSWWVKRLLSFWRLRTVGAATHTDASQRRLSRSVQKLVPSRRGSYAIMKRDLDKLKDQQTDLSALLLILHFSDGKTVNLETTSAKKARHLVYEIGEKYNLDLEAWALKDKAGNFLDDYKSLKQSNVRSGDELTVTLKYKALQFKTVTVLLHVMNNDGTFKILRVPVDPFTTVEELLRRVTMNAADELFLPLVIEGKLQGLWMEHIRTIASYGVTEATWLCHSVKMQKPLLLGSRLAMMRHGVLGTAETDERIALWWKILSHFSEWTSHQRKSDLNAALTCGVPTCLRVEVWDRVLNLSELCQANSGLFEKLADLDFGNCEEEIVLEKIERDLDRTMPYHPFFRTKHGKGQMLMLQVLRAFSMYDREIGYCQGLNFVCATLLTVLDPPRAFWAITVLLGRFGLRVNFVPGMMGLHAMLTSFEQQLGKQLPELSAFFAENGLITASFATEWFLTMFSACAVNGESTLPIWDVLIFKGAEFLPAFGFALLKVKEREMMDDPERAVDVLRNALKEDSGTAVQEVVAVALEHKKKR